MVKMDIELYRNEMAFQMGFTLKYIRNKRKKEASVGNVNKLNLGEKQIRPKK